MESQLSNNIQIQLQTPVKMFSLDSSSPSEIFYGNTLNLELIYLAKNNTPYARGSFIAQNPYTTIDATTDDTYTLGTFKNNNDVVQISIRCCEKTKCLAGQHKPNTYLCHIFDET